MSEDVLYTGKLKEFIPDNGQSNFDFVKNTLKQHYKDNNISSFNT